MAFCAHTTTHTMSHSPQPTLKPCAFTIPTKTDPDAMGGMVRGMGRGMGSLVDPGLAPEHLGQPAFSLLLAPISFPFMSYFLSLFNIYHSQPYEIHTYAGVTSCRHSST
jgi:hypothetical protein